MNPARLISISIFIFLLINLGSDNFISGQMIATDSGELRDSSLVSGADLLSREITRSENNSVGNGESVALLTSEFLIEISETTSMIFENFTIYIFTENNSTFQIVFGGLEQWRGSTDFIAIANFSIIDKNSLDQIEVFEIQSNGTKKLIFASSQTLIIKHQHLRSEHFDQPDNLFEYTIAEIKDLETNIFYGEIVAFLLSIGIALIFLFFLRHLKPVRVMWGTSPDREVKNYASGESQRKPRIPKKPDKIELGESK